MCNKPCVTAVEERPREAPYRLFVTIYHDPTGIDWTESRDETETLVSSDG
jgi:hypothetical protein